MTVVEMRELLVSFECLPKIVKQPTYLELCKYPGRRFEEICSRLLAFFFDPKKEHGFHDLFLRSLFEMLGINDIEYKEKDITAKLEVNAEGKRLDILVESRTFVIGIENKIYASVYNPLEKYKSLLQKQGNKRKILLVLSLRKLNENEIIKLNENNFSSYAYKEYFDIIKSKLGNYINQGNLKYLVLITDFIETMENMQGVSFMNKDVEDFFIDNSDKIDEMNKLYKSFREERWQKVVDRLYELQNEIAEKTNEKTGDGGWWIYNEYLLGYTSPSGILLDVRFEETGRNPLDKCHIFIVIKNNDKKAQEAWSTISEKVKSVYHDFEVQHNDYETFLPMAIIPAGDNEVILAKLQEIHLFLKNLTL
jgi:hypothetical protein